MSREEKWRQWSGRRTSRNQNWTESETAELINVWGNYLDILKLHRRTGKIYEKMAVEFAQCGYKRTSVELQKKVSNLTQEYRKERAKIINGQGPSKWKFFLVVEDIVTRLTLKREPQPSSSEALSPSPSQSQSQSRSSKPSESDGDNMDDVQFMAVYLNEQSMSEEEEQVPESQMPVIVSVESQHPATFQTKTVENLQPVQRTNQNKKVLQELQTDMRSVVQVSRQGQRTLLLRPNIQESGNNTVLKNLKTNMHRVLEESLDIHRQQVALQHRQVELQEDMLKIMAKFIDNCP